MLIVNSLVKSALHYYAEAAALLALGPAECMTLTDPSLQGLGGKFAHLRLVECPRDRGLRNSAAWRVQY